MGSKIPVLLAAMVVAMPIAAVGQDTRHDRHRPGLIVRTYDSYGVPFEDLQSARVFVDTIFGDAGVDVRWVDCWSKDREAAGIPTECLQPRGAHEVMLRLLGARAVPDRPLVLLGSALVNLQKRPSYLATVFVDLVEFVAGSAKMPFCRLLGRAIAHEIGHLLLNTNRHADQGLMRAVWSRAEIGQNDPADWVFRHDEAATIRAAAANRARGRSTMD
jgi:hypothetical protein